MGEEAGGRPRRSGKAPLSPGRAVLPAPPPEQREVGGRARAPPPTAAAALPPGTASLRRRGGAAPHATAGPGRASRRGRRGSLCGGTLGPVSGRSCASAEREIPPRLQRQPVSGVAWARQR